ncbi:Mu homology domain-containing protein [Tuber brumale]|nr:Mu homology domain-containing protein [Tuber brumale]
MSAVEALYVFDNFSPATTPILQHEWRSRPATTAASLYSLYKAQPSPRPSLIYLPTTSPPTLLFNIVHNNLLFLSPATSEIEPLLVSEFLHRVVNVLEDYLGSPLLGSKIEANYDIVAQLLNEMCDDGFPFTTEPNALRDVVLPPSLMGKLLGSVTGLPSASIPSSFTPSPTRTLSTIPWRRSNVRHTNNELYVDLIELITATIAPSGRFLSARSSGTIAFNCKLSGIPDLLMTLQAPTNHKQKLGAPPSGGLGFPVFHPCVRLSRWKERPGELSFVPPDGKFVLASYEIDLLPSGNPKSAIQPQLPVSVELKTAIGPQSSEFEARVFISTASLAPTANTLSANPFGPRSSRSPAFGGSSNNPAVEEVSIIFPLPPTVKTLTGTRCSRGEFHHEGRRVTWKIPTTGAFSGTATLRTGVVVKSYGGDESEGEEEAPVDNGEYQDVQTAKTTGANGGNEEEKAERERQAKRKMEMAMPRCALVAFSVKGWLASGVKVDSLKVVGGKGLGEGVKPYKGVKYLTKAGDIEVRC